MSDIDNKDNKPAGRKPLGLGGARKGPLRTNTSGRPAAVVVQKKKRKLVGAPGAAPVKPAQKAKAVVPKTDAIAEAAKRLGLSKEEYIKRKDAVETAQAEQAQRDSERKAEKAARQARAEADRLALEEKRKAEEAALREAEALAARKAEEARQEEANQEHARDHKQESKAATPQSNTHNSLESLGGRVKKSRQQPESKPSRSRNEDRSRRRGKLTIVSALAGDDERQRSLASMKRAREREKMRRGGGNQKDKVFREVVIPEAITVADLANRMTERTADVVKFLMTEGQMVKANEVIDADTAQLIVEEFGHSVKRVAAADVEDNFLDTDIDPPESLKPRPPVIAVMGHVDHGKTSLLDALRATDVASGEAGGITQHIGAYQLQLKTGQTITVLDTPGHAAFSAMRTRGAAAVDIVILVVAADDGIKPQTIESIKFAQAAGTPMIVAINKMDTYEANPLKIEQDLLQYEVITESMSGDVQVVPISALKKTGLDELSEAIVLQAEILDLQANPDRNADGLVIESKVEKGRGPVATLLVKRGTLKRSDIVVAGQQWGKVKALIDERGKQLKAAGPSVPVEILGLDGAPAPGEPFAVVENEAKAREITDYRIRKQKDGPAAGGGTTSMEQMLARLKDNEVEEISLLVKGDVQGSVEAIKSSIEGLGNDEVKARVVHGAVGGINESDVLLAKSTGAPIIGFNVRANRQAKALAEKEGVEIRYYSIIYGLLDDVKGVLEGLLQPERRETFIGYAEILQVFNISKLGKIAGCRVTEGKVERGAGVRLLRDDVVIHEGELSTLKRFKDEVQVVNAGMECGIGFEGYHDLRKGDMIECFTVEFLTRKLD